MAKRPALPTGHRQLVNHLIKGGLVQQDDSGAGWVCASRSGVNFRNETVARVQARGFSHGRARYKLVESTHAGKLMAEAEPPKPKRKQERSDGDPAHHR